MIYYEQTLKHEFRILIFRANGIGTGFLGHNIIL